LSSAIWAGRAALVVVVAGHAMAIDHLLPDGLYSHAAQITDLATYPVLLAAAVLIYVHFRLDAQGGAAWLATAAVFGISAGVGYAGLRTVMEPEIRSHPGWLALVEVLVAALLVVLLAASGRVPAPADPLLLGLALAILVTTARLGLMVRVEPFPAPDLVPLLAGAALALYAVTALLVVRSMRLPPGVAHCFAIVVGLLAVSHFLTYPVPPDDWRSVVSIGANLTGTVLLAVTSLRLVRDALRRQAESLLELEELHEELAHAEAHVRDGRTLLHEIAGTVAGITSASQLLASAAGLSEGKRHRLETLLVSETARLERLLMARDDVVIGELDLDRTIAPVLLAHRIRGCVIGWQPSGLRVLGRADDVVEVLDILLENSAQHSGSPAVQVIVSARDDEVDITVADQGRGIPREIADSVFDWGTHGRESHGQGIGLNVAHRLVTEQGGRLTLSSDEHVGTRVTVTLPAPSSPPTREEVQVAVGRGAI
jgi:signal transduction histidine kinase